MGMPSVVDILGRFREVDVRGNCFTWGETNGEEEIWWISEGEDYPRLWWELED